MSNNINYISIFKNAPLGMTLVSNTGEILDANDKMLEILGSPGLDKTKQVNMLTFPAIIESGIAEHYKKCFNEGIVVDFEAEYTTKWGKSTFLRSILTPTFNDKKEVTGCITIIEDVLVRKQIERALLESEEKFAKSFREAPVLITLSKIDDGTYIDVNEKFIELSGFNREEVIGKTSVELGWVSPEDRSRIFNGLKLNGYVKEMEIELFTKNKKKLQCLYNGEIIRVDNQELILSIALDITELKQSEKKFSTIFQFSPIAVAITRISDGLFIEVNKSWEILTGYSKEEIIGKTIYDIQLYPKTETRDELVAELRKNKKLDNVKITLQTKGNGILFGLFSTVSISINGEDCWITGFINLTEQTLLEKAIKDFRKTVLTSARDSLIKSLKNNKLVN
jgi:PAS domain S-box-containing protein